jgi:hypothetical protein
MVGDIFPVNWIELLLRNTALSSTYFSRFCNSNLPTSTAAQGSRPWAWAAPRSKPTTTTATAASPPNKLLGMSSQLERRNNFSDTIAPVPPPLPSTAHTIDPEEGPPTATSGEKTLLWIVAPSCDRIPSHHGTGETSPTLSTLPATKHAPGANMLGVGW